MLLRQMFPDGRAHGFVGPAIGSHHLHDRHATQLGDHAARKGVVRAVVVLPGSPGGRRLVPAQYIDEQAWEVEGREVFLEVREIEFGHGGSVSFWVP